MLPKWEKILVTGASSGIGRATAIECARMGATMLICGRNEERLIQTLKELPGEGHTTFIGDFVNEDDVKRLVKEISKIDGAVFCAGRGNKQPFLFDSRDKIDEVFDINFYAPVETFRLLVKQKKFNKNASAVFIVSISGNQDISIGNSVYGASKAALSAMLKYCAKELAPKGIRVNGINPGMVKTPLINKGTLTEEQLEEDMSRYPLKRYGNPEEIGYAAVYLLSNAADWITGQNIIIDGGITI